MEICRTFITRIPSPGSSVVVFVSGNDTVQAPEVGSTDSLTSYGLILVPLLSADNIVETWGVVVALL